MTEKTIVVGDVGVLIKMDMGEDVSAAASTSMRVTKPDGSVVTWPCSVSDLQYLTYTTSAGDIDQAGVYTVNPAVELGGFDANQSINGEVAHAMVFDNAVSTDTISKIANTVRLIPDKVPGEELLIPESYVDPIVNGTYDSLTGWTVVKGSNTTVTVTSGYGYINYLLDCTPNYLYQDITIPNASSVILEFDYSMWLDSYGHGFRILLDDTSIWYEGRTASGQTRSVDWTTVQVDISAYAGQTVRLKAPYHYDTSSTYCDVSDHHAWIKMDNIKLIME
jgi:hypothetical protein